MTELFTEVIVIILNNTKLSLTGWYCFQVSQNYRKINEEEREMMVGTTQIRDPVRNVVREEPEYIMRPQHARYGEYLTLPSLSLSLSDLRE